MDSSLTPGSNYLAPGIWFATDPASDNNWTGTIVVDTSAVAGQYQMLVTALVFGFPDTKKMKTFTINISEPDPC